MPPYPDPSLMTLSILECKRNCSHPVQKRSKYTLLVLSEWLTTRRRQLFFSRQRVMSETCSDTVLKSTHDVSLLCEPLCIAFASGYMCSENGDKRNKSDRTKVIHLFIFHSVEPINISGSIQWIQVVFNECRDFYEIKILWT